MKNYLVLAFVLLASVAFANTPDYSSTIEEVQTEQEDRDAAAREALPYSNVSFGDDVTAEDVEAAQESGQLSTVRSRQEGDVAIQERFRAKEAAFYKARLADLEAFEQDLTKETTLIAEQTKTIVALQETEDENAHGPKAQTADPAFLESSSNSLNPAPHAKSQQGDACQSATGNSASLSVDPVASQYENACEGPSFAEHSDCTQGAVKEINSESKGASANSTQVFEPTKPKNYTETQDVGQAEYGKVVLPSCPTQPRLAETKMANVADLIKSDRTSFEQADLVTGRTSTAFTAQPAPQTVAQKLVLPWYKNLLAWVFPQTLASLGDTTTLRGQTNNTGRENELAAQDFEKFRSDLRSHADMHGEQLFANRMSSMMEEQNKLLLTKLELTTQTSDNLEKISEFKHIEF